MIEQALLLWIAGCFVTYFVNDPFAPHALQGLSFPLAVLAVRGGHGCGCRWWSGAVAIALVTIPGLAYDARKIVRVARSQTVQYYLPASDEQALKWVGAHAPPGGVLAPTPFAIVVPSADRPRVWVGHGYWSRDYFPRSRQADALFGGHLRPARRAPSCARPEPRLLISDCGHHADLAVALRPLLASVQRFGCARSTCWPRGGRPAGRRTAAPTRSRRSRRPCCRPGRSEAELAAPRRR